MDFFDNTTAISELNIHNAPQLRCNEGKFTTCGHCESCKLGSKILHAKEWFFRCSEQAQRQFVLGLVHRFHSIDLHEYTNTLLKALEGKDFIYARSRNRPSLKEDMSGSVSNHALDAAKLRRDIIECLNWFELSPYWTKCNFMLGVMKFCSTQLLHAISNESRSFCLVHEEQSLSDTDGKSNKNVEELDGESNGLQNEEASLRVTFDSIYQISSISITPDGTYRPRSELKDQAKSFVEISSGSKNDLSTCNTRRPRSGSARHRSLQNTKDEIAPKLHAQELYEDDYVSVDPSSVTDHQLSTSCLLLQLHKDFIRCLPVHLSKLILSYLDKVSLVNCLCISRHWRMLCEEVQQDVLVHQIMVEEVMMMQGATAKGLSANYAKCLKVYIPKYEEEVRDEADADSANHTNLTLLRRADELKFRSMAYCYEGIEITDVYMEERNLFCGSYNVFVLKDSEDPNRCATYNGGSYVAVGSSDRRVKLINVSTGRIEKIIHGHSGSIRSVFVNEKRGFILSGSYDTSIRLWDLHSGKCCCIFRGHQGTVLCIALEGNVVASGSRDKSVKVWNIDTGKCRRTFRHRHVVECVEVSECLVVSGCQGCKVKVWDIEAAILIKSLDGHQCTITGVTFNHYHIVSSSTDCYALAWSTIGRHTKCLQAFRHPKAVHCVKLMYCRVITGAADGKLRIWSLLTGDCLRIIRGNSKNDVISSLYVVDDRIVINTLSNLLVLNFETVVWNYDLVPDRPESLGTLNNFAGAPPKSRSRAYVRAQKLVRGTAEVDKVIEPALSALSLSCLLERSFSTTPLNRKSVGRISSAPTHITRQVNNSIEQHVQRLHRARTPAVVEVRHPRKSRPQSSPAYMQSKYGQVKNGQKIKEHDLSIPQSVRPMNLSRSRVLTTSLSVPTLQTPVTIGQHQGWTTSAKDIVMPQNKLMLTAAQAREVVKRRSQTADSTKASPVPVFQKQTRKAEASRKCVAIEKPVSCLNLRTFSQQLENDRIHQDEKKRARKTSSISQVLRPQPCLT